MGIFDTALDKRFTESPELVLANVDGVDVLLIHNAADGSVYRIQASTLASFINSAISQANILDALDAPNGVATLDSGGKVPAAQLPAYVDDVLEYATASAFPVAGEAGKIYVALDTNLTYRWSGSGYVEISASLALGETASTAYRGDRGKTAYDHSQATGNPHGTSKGDVGLGNVDNTSDATKNSATATLSNKTLADPKINGGLYLGGTDAANYLKKYVEGTWTPVLGTTWAGPTAGGSASYSGTYTRIGDQVFLEFAINLNSNQAVAVDDRIGFTGLPFAPAVDLIQSAGVAWQYVAMGSGTNAFWEVGVATSSSQMFIYCSHIDGAPTYGGTIRGRLSYKTNAA